MVCLNKIFFSQEKYFYLEDLKNLTAKYEEFDMIDLRETIAKKKSLTQRLLKILAGHDYEPTLSKFYPTDFIHSTIVIIYLLVMCGLWFVFFLTISFFVINYLFKAC